MTMLYCVGCGERMFDYDGGALSYTHSCGSLVFITEDGNIFFPASFVLDMEKKEEKPHIDYYLGTSDFMDNLKRHLIGLLLKKGFVWKKDCKDCTKVITS